MVEQQPSKLMTRVRFPSPALMKSIATISFELEENLESSDELTEMLGLTAKSLLKAAAVAQLVEHFLGKEEVMSSSLISSSVK